MSEPEPGPYRPREFMAALYWDINSVAVFRMIFVDDVASRQDRQLHHVLCEITKRFMGNACFNLSTDNWDTVSKMISAAHRRIEVFARSRHLDWRGPLLPWAQYDDARNSLVPGLRQALQPDLNISFEHPHHTVITLKDSLRRPRYMGKPQQHIDNHVFLADGEECIGLDGPPLTPCLLCDGLTRCQCRVTPKTGDLLELREYEGKGIGVRCLTAIRKNDIIGEYIGSVEPEEFTPWTPYTLSQSGRIVSDSSGGLFRPIVADIQPHAIGNWSRFMNHSCDANCRFDAAVVGTRMATIIIARRDIGWGEELTVHYGFEYWDELKCPCGSAHCDNPRGSPSPSPDSRSHQVSDAEV